jgi:hypothetical protein
MRRILSCAAAGACLSIYGTDAHRTAASALGLSALGGDQCGSEVARAGLTMEDLG